jgi:lysyl-tRNA synthetase class 1
VKEMSDTFSVPPPITAVIEQFDKSSEPFTELDISSALNEARKRLVNPSPAENKGAWCEVVAFALMRTPGGSVWGTYFGPSASGVMQDGKPFYSPDIAEVDAEIIDHWAARATATTHPVLKARYADIVWDIGPLKTGKRGDYKMAQMAADAYTDAASEKYTSEAIYRFQYAFRSFDLAASLNDTGRVDKARNHIMNLHRISFANDMKLWWMAYEFLSERKGALPDKERDELAADLEKVLARSADVTNPKTFDPHTVKSAAGHLIKLYTRSKSTADIQRLYLSIAKATEHHAGLGNAMLASVFLQESLDAYRKAGLKDEAERVRILMQGKISEARREMKPITTEFRIPKEHMDAFLEQVVTDDLGTTFVRIATQFLPRRQEVENQVEELLKTAPLMARIGTSLMADNRVAARIGSVEDDPFGRVINQARMDFGLSDVWLHNAFVRAFEKHTLVPEQIVAWSNRLELFEELTFLIQGVTAWTEGDQIKALHVLVPQVEHALRQIVGNLGKPVTRAHPTVAGVSVAIGMGDILYSKEITDALGPDLTLYFLALYADPRGLNLRNELAHGLLKASHAHAGLVMWVIHTLLVLGVWKELAAARR